MTPLKSMEPNFRNMPKPCQKQLFPLEARGLPSNTWMPGPTPLTAPNDSSIALRTSTQRCNKVTIVTMGCRKFTPQTAPSPLTSPPKSNIPLPSPTPSHHPKRHQDPISRFATIPMCGQTDVGRYFSNITHRFCCGCMPCDSTGYGSTLGQTSSELTYFPIFCVQTRQNRNNDLNGSSNLKFWGALLQGGASGKGPNAKSD